MTDDELDALAARKEAGESLTEDDIDALADHLASQFLDDPSALLEHLSDDPALATKQRRLLEMLAQRDDDEEDEDELRAMLHDSHVRTADMYWFEQGRKERLECEQADDLEMAHQQRMADAVAGWFRKNAAE